MCLGVVFIWEGLYLMNHPRPHPNDGDALGGFVIAAVIGWPLACIGLCGLVGMLRGKLLRGLTWGLGISMIPLAVVMIVMPILEAVLRQRK
jgi:hypothetical protein